MCFCGLSGMLISPNRMSLEFFRHACSGQVIATSHDLGAQTVAEDGKSPDFREISGWWSIMIWLDVSSSLGQIPGGCFQERVFFQDLGWGIQSIYHGIPTAPYPQEKLTWLWKMLIANGTYFLLLVHFPASYVNRSVHHHVVWSILISFALVYPTPAGIKTKNTFALEVKDHSKKLSPLQLLILHPF